VEVGTSESIDEKKEPSAHPSRSPDGTWRNQNGSWSL
jgi:hypothetical protein